METDCFTVGKTEGFTVEKKNETERFTVETERLTVEIERFTVDNKFLALTTSCLALKNRARTVGN